MGEEDDLTIGEIGRTLNRIESSVSDLSDNLDKTYVRQDVWQKSEIASGLRVGEVQDDVKELERRFMEFVADQRTGNRSRIEHLVYPVLTGVTIAAVLQLLDFVK